MNIRKLHIRHIKLTPYRSVVKRKIFCFAKRIQFLENYYPIYISTLSLKHIYDKRTAREYDFIIKNLKRIVEKPDEIRKNTTQRDNSYLVIKNISSETFLAVIEVINGSVFIVTSFSSGEKYLRNFKLVWNREAGLPPS